MKFIMSFIFACLLTAISISKVYSQEKSLRIQCKNFNGVSQVFTNGYIDSDKDGFSSQIMNFDIPVPVEMGKLVKIH